MIYFIRENHAGAIKIGYTEKAPEQRLRELQTGSPNKLYLIATMPGEKKDEAILHLLFAKYRLNSEWFSQNNELELFINTHAKYEYSEFLIRMQLNKIKPQLEEAHKQQISFNLPNALKEIERYSIIEALKITKGKQAAAARLLSITKSGLHQKLKQYCISAKDYIDSQNEYGLSGFEPAGLHS